MLENSIISLQNVNKWFGDFPRFTRCYLRSKKERSVLLYVVRQDLVNQQ